SSSAIVAGHDVRTAVITCGGHASHSVERVHIDSLCNVAWLLASYLQSGPVVRRDQQVIAPLDGSSHQLEAGQIPSQEGRLPWPDARSRGYALVAGPKIDCVCLRGQLRAVWAIASPSGFTDEVVHYVGGVQVRLGVAVAITRRGTVMAKLAGQDRRYGRA